MICGARLDKCSRVRLAACDKDCFDISENCCNPGSRNRQFSGSGDLSIPDMVMSGFNWKSTVFVNFSGPSSGSILAAPGTALASDNGKCQIAYVLKDLVDVWLPITGRHQVRTRTNPVGS
jgi:hypothetical protein